MKNFIYVCFHDIRILFGTCIFTWFVIWISIIREL